MGLDLIDQQDEAVGWGFIAQPRSAEMFGPRPDKQIREAYDPPYSGREVGVGDGTVGHSHRGELTRLFEVNSYGLVRGHWFVRMGQPLNDPFQQAEGGVRSVARPTVVPADPIPDHALA